MLVCIGHSLQVRDLDSLGHELSSISVESYFGKWAKAFNVVRSITPHPALELIRNWGTQLDIRAKCVEHVQAGNATHWKLSLSDRLVGGLDLVGDSSDEDSPTETFDVYANESSGRFSAFTSSTDGHVSRVFSEYVTRECRGSIQLWQCGAEEGPCRENDVWEAPNGFMFQLDSAGVCPSGNPLARPPVHVVPMYRASCMDHALGVADAFRSNHPTCRSA